MIWQPTQRVWAGDDLKVNEDELEADAMQGVESTPVTGASGGKIGTAGTGSARSQSMSISATASASGVDAEDEEA